MMGAMKIEIDNQTIQFHVQYSKTKKISIQIDPTGFITVKVPNGTSEESIINAVERQGKWILERMRYLEVAREAATPKPKEYEGTGTFLHLGKPFSLQQLIETNGLTEEQLKENLKRFYFASCKKMVGERLKIYQAKLKVKPKSFEIVESKTKWGTCSSDKTLTFNYRLAMAPIEVIDYVVIHELCHLFHMNHDRSFWRLVGSIMPDYKLKEQYLARFGQHMTM